MQEGFKPIQENTEQAPEISKKTLEEAKKLTTLVYILQAVGIVSGITFIAGIIVNYLKCDEVKGTLAESHFRWQIRTFWFGLLWGVLGMILTMLVIGFLVVLANAIWMIYRIVKGWLALNAGQPMYADE